MKRIVRLLVVVVLGVSSFGSQLLESLRRVAGLVRLAALDF